VAARETAKTAKGKLVLEKFNATCAASAATGFHNLRRGGFEPPTGSGCHSQTIFISSQIKKLCKKPAKKD
jgi:hypothetical protein